MDGRLGTSFSHRGSRKMESFCVFSPRNRITITFQNLKTLKSSSQPALSFKEKNIDAKL